MANIMGQRGIEDAQDMSRQLGAFSKTLSKMAEEKKARHHARGAALAQEQATLNAEKLIQLQDELGTLTDTDTRFHEIKAEMLKLSGPDVYPDAERIAQLSPWEQTGYLKEKLRAFNDTFADKLSHSMMTSEKALKIENITFTPKELHDNNIHGMPFKEAAVHMIARDIREQAGLAKFSPELLELAGTNKAILDAKDQIIAKYRARYNVESSSQHRSKAETTWKTSQKTGEDIYHYLVKTGATVDANNNIVGNAGAWKAFESIVVAEGINENDSDYATRILSQPMPDRLAIKVGAKKGTTYAEHWPGKVRDLKQQIRDGYTKKIDNDLKNLEAAGKGVEVEFIEKARQGDLTSTQVNEYKRRFGELGLTIPSSVTNYETASDRNEREDKDTLEALVASQNGYISHEQLDAFHPKAALEYREKATRLEKAALKEFSAEDKIKANLNTVFTGMGIKGNEKSVDYIRALENAKVDYAEKYNKYVGMGYEPAIANHYALYADTVVDPETKEPIPDSMGVIKEIETKREGNKYIKAGQSVEKDLKPGAHRVVQIKMAKEEIANDVSAVTKTVLGGYYGQKQINKIQENIEKYGPRGLYMDKGALAYYKGIARGRNPREGGWWGIVDAQLKANGYTEGLSQSRPNAVSLLTGVDEKGNTIPNERGTMKIDAEVARAMAYPGFETASYANKLLEDTMRQGKGQSVWDEAGNLQHYLPNLIPGYISNEEMSTYLKKKSDMPSDWKDTLLRLPDMDGDPYVRELPDDPVKRRKIEEARRRMENNPLGDFLR